MKGTYPLMSKLLFIAFFTVSTFGCSTSPLRFPVPEADQSYAKIEGINNQIRFWGDESPPNVGLMVAKKQEQMRSRLVTGKVTSPIQLNYLAISGGGPDGAFGAGLLAGWEIHGTRPEFEIVTGVSTGALIAPFAFLGPEYDDRLKEAYTTLSSNNIITTSLTKIVRALLGGTALGDTSPFAKTIRRYTDEEMFKAIAKEHLRGRRLYIGTTNLDAERPMVWDIGELANSGHPNALQLFRKILQASAAIPVAMPPVLFNVEANGKKYQELHVDGGVTSNVFLYPAEINLNRIKDSGIKANRTLYVIRNSKITPKYEAVSFGLYSISKRSINSLLKYQGIGDLYKLKSIADRDRLAYKLAYIPDDFEAKSEEVFDRDYMTALYNYGFEIARKGFLWAETPTILDK